MVNLSYFIQATAANMSFSVIDFPVIDSTAKGISTIYTVDC